MRILLIDDSATSVRLIEGLLRTTKGDTKFEVARVNGLFAALRRFDEAEGRFDAILLDLGLPECGGLTSLKMIRAHAATIPVVIITAEDNPQVMSDAALAGANDYLVKGRFDGFMLEQSLRQVVAHSASWVEEADRPELQGAFRRGSPADSETIG